VVGWATNRGIAVAPWMRGEGSVMGVEARKHTIIPPPDEGGCPEIGPLERFDALHSMLLVRLQGLEEAADREPRRPLRDLLLAYVRLAGSLRALLSGALGRVSADAHFGEAVRWTYLWAIDEVEFVQCTLENGGVAQAAAIPREALSIFYEVARGEGGPTVSPSERETLLALDETIFRMMQMQDWIMDLALG
jgi:hypothetical protein